MGKESVSNSAEPSLGRLIRVYPEGCYRVLKSPILESLTSGTVNSVSITVPVLSHLVGLEPVWFYINKVCPRGRGSNCLV